MKSLYALILLFALMSQTIWSQGTSVLMQKEGSDIDFSGQLNQRRQLKLDDPFLVQLYGRWKALGAVAPETNEWLQLMFYGENAKAFLISHKAELSDPKLTALKKPVELYLLFKLGYYQSFYENWIDYSANSNFLDTELGMALDQVVGPQASLVLLNQGFFIDEKASKNLAKIEDKQVNLNYSLQAYKALRSGEDTIKWIGYLSPEDELRQELAKSAILAYARTGQLGASGKLISKVVEPWIEKSEKPEEIALYYMTLGRLLYQAGAYEQAENFYYRIPESSRYFLEARTEALWVQLQERDFPTAQGQLETLKMNVFTDQFYPEIFLAQAIGNTMTCQFIEAQRSIQSFVNVNRSWAKKIDAALVSENVPMVQENFYVKAIRKRQKAIEVEKESLNKLGITVYDARFAENQDVAKKLLRDEAARQWMNRKEILDSAIYKMKFVRVELLSRMRAIAQGIKDSFTADSVSVYQSAKARESRNEMSFRNDGMLWGDELFRMSAEVHNMCLQMYK